VRRRGFASGLAVSGIGIGTLAMPPLASFLIELLGWRGAYLALGALAAAIGGGMALLIENDPRDPTAIRRNRARNRRIAKALRCARRSARAASSACTPPV
jgi:predicted MFS family arabinose efflux permease